MSIVATHDELAWPSVRAGHGKARVQLHDELLARASGAVTNCACETSCPACVGPTSPAGDGRADRKTLVGALLAALRRH